MPLPRRAILGRGVDQLEHDEQCCTERIDLAAGVSSGMSVDWTELAGESETTRPITRLSSALRAISPNSERVRFETTCADMCRHAGLQLVRQREQVDDQCASPVPADWRPGGAEHQVACGSSSCDECGWPPPKTDLLVGQGRLVHNASERKPRMSYAARSNPRDRPRVLFTSV